jgi:broad specificity phosphatase PhoE
MTTWVFLRHGESTANAAGRLSGWQDVELTDRGRVQAKKAAAELAGFELARCLVSDLGRARETAALALAGRSVPTHVVPELRERSMGVLQGELAAEVRARGDSARWLQPWAVGPPGGEASAWAAGRALAALRHWDDGRPTLVVAHGAVIRNLLGVLDGVPEDQIARGAAVPNAEAVVRRAYLPPAPLGGLPVCSWGVAT